MIVFLKRLLTILLFFIAIAVLFFVIVFFTSYSIKPWNIKGFSSLLEEDYGFSYDKETFETFSIKYPQYYKNNTFIVVQTRAENETVYTGNNPYSIIVRFWSFEDEKNVCIQSLQVLNDAINYSDCNVNF